MKSTFKRVLLAIAAAAVIGFGFTGCQQEAETEYVDKIVDNYILVLPIESTDSLIGSWTYTWPDTGYGEYKEQYNISTTTFDNNNGDGSGSYYAGNKLCVLKLSETEGYIYVKYTRSMNADYSYSETAPDVGKWYAIHYEGLTTTSIKLSGAAGTKTSAETLAEAIREFTVANGYFNTHSSLTK